MCERVANNAILCDCGNDAGQARLENITGFSLLVWIKMQLGKHRCSRSTIHVQKAVFINIKNKKWKWLEQTKWNHCVDGNGGITLKTERLHHVDHIVMQLRTE